MTDRRFICFSAALPRHSTRFLRRRQALRKLRMFDERGGAPC